MYFVHLSKVDIRYICIFCTYSKFKRPHVMANNVYFDAIWNLLSITRFKVLLSRMNLVLIFGVLLSVISTLRCFHSTTVGTNTYGMPRTTQSPTKSTTLSSNGSSTKEGEKYAWNFLPDIQPWTSAHIFLIHKYCKNRHTLCTLKMLL